MGAISSSSNHMPLCTHTHIIFTHHSCNTHKEIFINGLNLGQHHSQSQFFPLEEAK